MIRPFQNHVPDCVLRVKVLLTHCSQTPVQALLNRLHLLVVPPRKRIANKIQVHELILSHKLSKVLHTRRRSVVAPLFLIITYNVIKIPNEESHSPIVPKPPAQIPLLIPPFFLISTSIDSKQIPVTLLELIPNFNFNNKVPRLHQSDLGSIPPEYTEASPNVSGFHSVHVLQIQTFLEIPIPTTFILGFQQNHNVRGVEPILLQQIVNCQVTPDTLTVPSE
ncbi:hypothetical protein EV1_007594 [Malus domestica]